MGLVCQGQRSLSKIQEECPDIVLERDFRLAEQVPQQYTTLKQKATLHDAQQTNSLRLMKHLQNEMILQSRFEGGFGEGPAYVYWQKKIFIQGILKKGLLHGEFVLIDRQKGVKAEGICIEGKLNEIEVKCSDLWYRKKYSLTNLQEAEYKFQKGAIEAIQIKFDTNEGSIMYRNGSKFIGALKLSQEGLAIPKKGTLLYPTISKLRSYEGQFNQSGMLDGKGTIYWRDNSIYEGDFKDGMRYGNGLYIKPTEQKIYGEWSKDKFIREKSEFSTGVTKESQKMLSGRSLPNRNPNRN